MTTIQTIVYAKGGRRIGVVVNGIVDTIEEDLGDLRAESRRTGVTSALIQGRVTQILDFDVLCADIASRELPTPRHRDAA